MKTEKFEIGDTVTYFLKGKQRVGKVLRSDHEVRIYLVEFMPSTSVWLSYVQLSKVN